ncbi:MAG: hypothetical protein Q9P01_21460 [Anaerolineae bacterium]|nr:hypothetical protein [Anaerolineae bacterium]
MWHNSGFQADAIKRWQPLYTRLFASRWTIIVLIMLGIARALFFLQAYAPADGADASDYYAYAAYVNGIDLPSRVANLSPLYPYFVYVNHYIFGNFDLIIFWQIIMSASLGLLYYLGLRRYHALWAVLVALMVIGDAQTGVSFNFASTEPLYVFLLACVYSLTLIQHQSIAKNALQLRDVLLGVMLVLLRETRTVARYAFVPVWILFALATQNWKRTFIIALTFVVTTVFFDISTQVAQVAQESSYNDSMLLRPLLNYDLLDSEAGRLRQI